MSPDPIRRALTRKVTQRSHRGRTTDVEIPPNEKLVLGVKLVIAFLVCLTVLEVVYLAVMKTWNTEVFTVISGLVGTLVGVFFSQKG